MVRNGVLFVVVAACCEVVAKTAFDLNQGCEDESSCLEDMHIAPSSLLQVSISQARGVVGDRSPANISTKGEALTPRFPRSPAPVAALEQGRGERGGARHLENDRCLLAPALAVALGVVLNLVGRWQRVAKLLVFFGAQTVMNIYMKIVFSEVVVSEALGLNGIQAPFAVTAMQQVVAFALVSLGTFISRWTPWPYTCRYLTSWREWRTLLASCMCFCGNIALNNFSLSLLDLSSNLVIRSFAPVTTLILQVTMGECLRLHFKRMPSFRSTCFLIFGVLCGMVAICIKAWNQSSIESAHYRYGVVVCSGSLIAASLELIVVRKLGDASRLNPLDTILHMTIPCACLLCIPVLTYSHAVQWTGYSPMTDLQIIGVALSNNRHVFGYVAVSGVFAAMYNCLLYSIVQSMSPTIAAYSSNVNKIATLGYSFLLGMESLPDGRCGVVMVVAIAGSLAAFMLYGVDEASEFQASGQTHSKEDGLQESRANSLKALK
eukprot:TRINITY_DN14422_c0_g1_i1.p1 TRINITY_DN14422_c0_g1~~TRINITY_DN14422_c0_g1_i1.p1  ORF type:complete len:491 (-),score=59.99 TRINITY_DN14422_c0_g1_i1:49-1521(-)